MAQGPVNFYGVRNKWGVFSNFYKAKIVLKGKEWATAEHYFQAQKFAGTEHEERIRLLKTPAETKKEGNNRKLPLRKDWAEVKDSVMYDIVYAKFSQRPALRKVLFETGDRTICEHTKNDKYWGDGGDGSGKNKLGLTLMKVRGELRKERLKEDEENDETEETEEKEEKETSKEDVDPPKESKKRKRPTNEEPLKAKRKVTTKKSKK